MSDSLADQFATTALYGGNADFVEDLYEQFLKDPASVEPGWARYFAGLARGAAPAGAAGTHRQIRERLAAQLPRAAASAPSAAGGETAGAASAKQAAVSRLIQVHANRGHLIANLDPLGLSPRGMPYILDPKYFGLSDADMETEFFTGSRTAALPARSKLKDILATLKLIYCDTIGAEFAHVSDTEERLWLQDNFQAERIQHRFSAEEKKNILWQLTAAEGLERYLHTKYVGQKRFSLEGGDSLIPLLDELVQQEGRAGIEETVIGMAHRGRLNVLVNLLGKSPKDLFIEFEGQYDLKKLRGSGDVKYHKGFSADLKTPAGNVHVALAFNPSHLEVVNPVVEGSVRARQERRGDATGRQGARRADPRRRRLRGTGRRDGDDAAVAGPGLLHGRLGSHHHQQSGRFHHLESARCALDAVLLGCREDDRGADLPRQRRRSRGGLFRHAFRARIPAQVPQGRGHRSRMLSPARTQRGRRACGDPAVDVPGHPQEADRASAVRGQAGGRGRDHRGRRRGDDGSIPHGSR